MKIFSENNEVTISSEILNEISEHTGLPIDGIKKIINENLLLNKETSDNYIESIRSYFFKDQKMLTYIDFKKSFEDELFETKNKQETINKFLKTLNTFDPTKVDTLSLLSFVKDILILDNTKDKDKLSNLLSISTGMDYVKLNESSEFLFDNSIVDYGSLKNLLTKNNKRWNLSKDVYNTYQQILNYIEEKIDNIDSNVIEYNDKFQENLINEYVSGIVSPLNISYSSNKQLVSNIQSLVFDFIVTVNYYINSKHEYHDYVKQSKFVLYDENVNLLIQELYSSLYESKVINEHYIEDVLNDKVTVDTNLNLIDNLTSLIKIKQSSLNRFNASNVKEILRYIKSASFDFNLKLRPMLKIYVNNTMEIVNTLNKVYFQLKNK